MGTHMARAQSTGGVTFETPHLGGAISPTHQDGTEFRLGFILGGIGVAGVVGEVRSGAWGTEVALSALRLQDRSMAVTLKRYAGEGSVKAFLGMGLWGLRVRGEAQTGSIVILRAPIGLEGIVDQSHALGAEVGLNRAWMVRRVDPDDDTPPNRRIIPFPGVHYRYGFQR